MKYTAQIRHTITDAVIKNTADATDLRQPPQWELEGLPGWQFRQEGTELIAIDTDNDSENNEWRVYREYKDSSFGAVTPEDLASGSFRARLERYDAEVDIPLDELF